MNNSRMLQQLHAMFGIFMVMFYIGAGIFLIFFAKMFAIDKFVRGFIGSTFLLYGLYRITVTYKQLKEAFSSHDEEEE
jgi:hypothetical protein